MLTKKGRMGPMGIEHFVVAADVAISKVKRGAIMIERPFFSSESSDDSEPTTGHWHGLFQ